MPDSGARYFVGSFITIRAPRRARNCSNSHRFGLVSHGVDTSTGLSGHSVEAIAVMEGGEIPHGLYQNVIFLPQFGAGFHHARA